MNQCGSSRVVPRYDQEIKFLKRAADADCQYIIGLIGCWEDGGGLNRAFFLELGTLDMEHWLEEKQEGRGGYGGIVVWRGSWYGVGEGRGGGERNGGEGDS